MEQEACLLGSASVPGAVTNGLRAVHIEAGSDAAGGSAAVQCGALVRVLLSGVPPSLPSVPFDSLEYSCYCFFPIKKLCC